MGTSHEDLRTFMMSHSALLGIIMFHTKLCRENQNIHFVFVLCMR